MKKTQKTVQIMVVSILFVTLISVFFALFISQTNKMTQNTTLNSVNEIAAHDRLIIENFLEHNWDELRGISKRLIAYNCDTLLMAQERISLERSTSGFHTLYLVSEDGTVYNDRYAVYTKDQLDILTYLENEKEAVACRYDYTLTTKEQKEVILYAVPLEDYEVEGVKFTYLAAVAPINQIQEHMAIYSFYKDGENRGCTSVINLNGDYIVNTERTASVNQRDNLYDILEKGKREPEWTKEAVMESMEREESFQISYVDENNISKVLFFIPVEGVSWYLVTSVEKSVFTDLIRTFVFSTASMVMISIVVSVCMFLILLRLRRNVVAATAAAKARSEFLSNMSHEIRTPLNGIIGLLHLMDTHLYDGDTQQISNWIQKANGTAQYLLSLISDILDMSKIQAGKLTLNPEPFLVEHMLDSVESMQRGNVSGRGVELILEKDIAYPCLLGDETHIKQVLMNIVGNAAKFTESGGFIRLSAFQKKEKNDLVTTTIICEDTGIGMTQEFQKRIWDSFTQDHNKVSNGMRGTGLGMSISKGIMDAMGGEISVVSELGKGSTFQISFSLETAEMDIPVETQSEALETAEKPLPNMKLLVAEDNELNAEIIMELLHDSDYDAVLAENGKQAVEAFQHSAVGEFDAILMDMQMPEMDGCQATRTIRSMNRPDAKSIVIFACTANSFQEDKERAMASGMNDFLTKPIDIMQLLGRLAELQKEKEEHQ